MPESHRISIRVHTPLLEWIEQQALEGESPSKVVQRLIVDLATSEGVVLGDRIDRLDDRISQVNASVNERLVALESALADFKKETLERPGFGKIEVLKEMIEDLGKTKPKSDRELLAELEELVQNATDRADAGYVSRYDCFNQIWTPFWEIKNQIETYVDYCDPDASYEEDLKAYLNAAKEQIK